MSVGRKVIMLLNVHDNIVKMDKLAGIMEMVLSLYEFDNTDNLENGRLSNVLLRCHVTGSDEFTCSEPVTPQYKQHRIWGVHFPNPVNNGPKGQWHN